MVTLRSVEHAGPCGRLLMLAFVAALTLGRSVSALAGDDGKLPWPSVEDAIAMSRVQRGATATDRIGAVSPDGALFAFVRYHGDQKRNVIVYQLSVIDLRLKARESMVRTVLTRDFVGEAADQNASPFEHVTFLDDNRTIAYIGREASGGRQVFSVNVDTGQTRQLTHSAMPVREFIANVDDGVTIFSTAVPSEEDAVRASRMEEDGVFVWDEELFSPAKNVKSKAILALLDDPQPRAFRQYFAHANGEASLIYDSRQNRSPAVAKIAAEIDRGVSVQAHEDWVLRYWGSLTADPNGSSALLFPYGPAHGRAAGADAEHLSRWTSKLDTPYGLVNIERQQIDVFIDVPHAIGRGPGGAPPIWSPDGRSVLLFAVPPASSGKSRAQWIDVNVATRKFQAVGVPEGWQVVGWYGASAGAILNNGNHFALIRRNTRGHWGKLEDLGAYENLNWRWPPATNGRLILGLVEGLQSPPELIAIDVETRSTTVLTDLNPTLRQRRYGHIERFTWRHKYDDQASGYLIKPDELPTSKRSPLVILLDDRALKGIDQPYLLDGFGQRNGHATQMLAARGFVVLYTREPRGMKGPECEVMREHIDSAIEQLDEAGVIDPDRVGLSGWSRAAYHTNCLLITSHRKLAAASMMDGGSYDYVPTMRPYTDAELSRIQAPILMESYGLHTFVAHAFLADRLESMGKPVELLYYQSSPHSTVRPQHRYRSLQTHIDWWQFWLQGVEDPDPKKVRQFQHWRTLRTIWSEGQRCARIESATNRGVKARNCER